MMYMPTFESCLAEAMDRFVALQRLSGTDYESPIRILERFDRFVSSQTHDDPYVSPQIVEGYLGTLTHLHPRTRQNHVSVVRKFCRHLSLFDERCYIPEPVRWTPAWSSRIPYIFTKDQICSILAHAAKLGPWYWPLRAPTYGTVYGLMYVAGLRQSEVLSLNIRDFHFKSSRLHIRRAKFRKERWVSLAPSTCEVLASYIDMRTTIVPAEPDDALFVVPPAHKRLGQSAFQRNFQQLLRACNISEAGGRRPRPHDLRHSYAVHRLLGWYREGRDVNALLPVLSTQMGHVDISSTQVYLHAIPELLGEVEKRFLHYYRDNVKQGGEPWK